MGRITIGEKEFDLTEAEEANILILQDLINALRRIASKP